MYIQNRIMGKNQHVVSYKTQSQWAKKREDNQKITRIVLTPKQAIVIAQKIAKHRQSELLIHKRMEILAVKTAMGMTHVTLKDNSL